MPLAQDSKRFTMSELHVRWMIAGHGGYTERRLVLRIPSLYNVLLFIVIAVTVAEVWLLWKR